MMNDALIIRCNIVKSPEDMKRLRQHILRQLKTGTVVLPYYCDTIQVPENVLIKLMDHTGYITDLKGEEE